MLACHASLLVLERMWFWQCCHKRHWSCPMLVPYLRLKGKHCQQLKQLVRPANLASWAEDNLRTAMHPPVLSSDSLACNQSQAKCKVPICHTKTDSMGRVFVVIPRVLGTAFKVMACGFKVKKDGRFVQADRASRDACLFGPSAKNRKLRSRIAAVSPASPGQSMDSSQHCKP